jgi:pectin methylesterase-like acyl-CoA thioesterase
MKILGSILLVLAVALALGAQSQDQNMGQNSQANQGSQSSSSSSNQNLSGTVSHDRQSVKNDKDSKNYKVDNPEALQGKQDQHVALVVHVDPDNNVIHVIQIEPPQ